jgi:radical SAM protein with 4Fe4S-binding SPASM domain
MIELLERLGYYPRFCVWELTLGCNLRCLHCGSYAGDKRRDELTLEESLKIADQLAEMGCEKVTLGGGEPTLNPDWHLIGKRLTERGVRVNMIANGWHWTKGHVDKAREGGLANVAFSLDGFEEAHDRQRREDSYRRVIEAIDICVAEEMPVSVITTINKLNAPTLRDLRDFLGEKGVASWQLQIGIPSGTMSHYKDELVVEPEAMLELVPLIAELRTDGVERPIVYPSDNIGYFGKYEKALRDRGAQINFWIGCRAGLQVIGIESDGGVKGCLSLPSAMHGKEDIFLEGNLREQSLHELWTRQSAFSYNRDFAMEQLSGFCARCRFRDICRGGCAWTAYSHTSNRFDNPYCFYRQAVVRRQFDLIDEEPTDDEITFAEPGLSYADDDPAMTPAAKARQQAEEAAVQQHPQPVTPAASPADADA